MVCKIAPVRTIGSSSPWRDTKLAGEWTPAKKVDLRWADVAIRSDRVEERSIRGRRGGLRSNAGARAEPRSVRYDATIVPDIEVGGIHWDDVVDVVCVGRGAGALAAVIAANRNGMSIFMACAGLGDGEGGNDADSLAERLGVADVATVDYLTALTEDVGPLIRCAVPSQVPLRTIDGPTADSRRGRIATFVGSALRGWADRCLASPYGLLYTNLAHSTTETYTSAGASIEATVVGTIDVENGRLTEELDQWLSVRADELGIDGDSPDSLQRLVFDGGQVVGAIFDTPSGPRSVRALLGVVMETGGRAIAPTPPTDGLDDASSVTVALVTRAASRFARLELLATPR
jgi:hypothetical protein